jgi:ABC-2 type transport system permease protein
MSLATLLLGKALVGTFFAVLVSLVPVGIGVLVLHVPVANAALLVAALLLSSLTFSSLGLAFASIPARSVGSIMMPSTLIRWPLLFVSGVFIALGEMALWTRVLSYLSPLTYSQDLINHAVPSTGYLSPWLDLAVLPVLTVVFLFTAARLHKRSRVLGY